MERAVATDRERGQAPADKVRFAYVGLDHGHAREYLESLRLLPEAEVVALYDPDPDVARRAVPPELRDRPLYDDLAVLLDRARPEAVLLTLPNDVTPRAVVHCAEAGVHCFVEKPAGRTAADLEPVAAAVRRHHVRFHLGYIHRFGAPGATMRALVREGLLGEIQSVEARWITTSVRERGPRHLAFSRARSGGGILHWLGCHWLDLMRYVTGLEAATVSALLETRSGEPIDVEDTAVVAMRLANGALASLHAAYSTGPNDRFFGVRGSLGWVRWEQNRPEITVRSEHATWSAAPERTVTFTRPAVGGYAGAAGLASLRSFIASFRGDARPMYDVHDARRVLEIVDAAHRSAVTGRVVPVG
jgi:predicted dehydrogenase